MKAFVIVILIISILGNAVGLYFAYQWYKQGRTIRNLQSNMLKKNRFISSVNEGLDRRLLFIHHSCGRIWLDEGELRDELFRNGIAVHDATYGDEIGEYTDLCHWVPKFSDQIDKILTFDFHPDNYYGDSRKNDIIMFKSCYPNSNISSDGAIPGDPLAREMTTQNYKAVFEELGKVFAEHPEQTFIYVTAPPLEPGSTSPDNASRARAFNNWVKSDFVSGYGDKTGLNNFLVFDFFDVLADPDNHLREEYRLNSYAGDSHPNAKGTRAATEKFLVFLEEHCLIGQAESESGSND